MVQTASLLWSRYGPTPWHRLGFKEWRKLLRGSSSLKRHFYTCSLSQECAGDVRMRSGGMRLVEGAVVLGVETSCDDTGVGVVDVSGRVRGEALHSQLKEHQKTGGIIPSVAAALHRENLERVTQLALEKSGMEVGEVAAIAVTMGPGLAICLSEGVAFAKELARKASKPLVSVHHMEAHALTPRIDCDIPFPYLVLLVSGGHCILAVVHGPGKFSRLGQSLDDSPGEAFDKVARWLCWDRHPDVSNLSGGAAIEVLAARGDPSKFSLPHVMQRKRCCNFSFAGLKTSVQKIISKIAVQSDWDRLSPLPGCEDMAASFQEAVCKHLVTRTHRAILFCQTWAPSVRHMGRRLRDQVWKHLHKQNLIPYLPRRERIRSGLIPRFNHWVVSGGVASNHFLRHQLSSLASFYGLTPHFPPPQLCTDNGIMIAWAAIEHLRAGGDAVSCLESLYYRPKWPLGVDVSKKVEKAEIKLSHRKTNPKI